MYVGTGTSMIRFPFVQCVVAHTCPCRGLHCLSALGYGPLRDVTALRLEEVGEMCMFPPIGVCSHPFPDVGPVAGKMRVDLYSGPLTLKAVKP